EPLQVYPGLSDFTCSQWGDARNCYLPTRDVEAVDAANNVWSRNEKPVFARPHILVALMV
ncbi:hypothetical protein L195_g015863, partial [Trifolium pratense]